MTDDQRFLELRDRLWAVESCLTATIRLLRHIAEGDEKKQLDEILERMPP